MALFGYSRSKFMDELDTPLSTGEGVLSPAVQRARVRANIGVGSPTEGIGTPNTGVTATEYGDPFQHTSVLTFTNLVIGAAGDLSSLARGVLLYTFPAGIIRVTGSLMSVGLTYSGGATPTTDTPDLGLGTVIATGAVATLDGTPTFENIMTGQTVNDVAGTVEFASVGTVLGIAAASAHTVHLNVADDWSDLTPNNPNVLATGTVSLTWERVTAS